jgi:hypothetical protein
MKSHTFLIGQRVIVKNEIGTVTTGKTLDKNGRHSVEEPDKWGGVWVYLPSRGYACCYAKGNVKPLPNNQL